MVTLVVHHRVSDHATWKPVFDEHEGVRRSHGEIEHCLYQDPLEPNRIVVHNDFPTVEAARGLMADPSLQDAMERGGGEGEPGVGLAELAERKVSRPRRRPERRLPSEPGDKALGAYRFVVRRSP